jgi:hypothetical protein
MDIRGLILVNTSGESEGNEQSFSSLPPGLLDVVGKNAVQRTAERLHRYGISEVTAVIEGPVALASRGRSNGTPHSITTSRERFWRVAENTFNELAQGGAELVILIRLGAYAEVDFEKLAEFHLDRACRVSQMSYADQPMEVFCISASRRNDAASLFRSQLTRCRTDCPVLEHAGYYNPLADAHDLREFAIHILTLKTETRPAGTEVKPGVWVAQRAQVEKGARVLAPAFIGSFARIRTGVVITRCSTVEQHAQVDCGTVVENSSVLPYSYIGAGLDLAHSVVGEGQLANLRRNAMIEIVDPKLIGHIAASSGHKVLSAAADLLTFLPRQAWRGIVGRKPVAPDLTEALHQTSPALGKAAGYEAPACNTEAADEFPSLAVVRRYGHQ